VLIGSFWSARTEYQAMLKLIAERKARLCAQRLARETAKSAQAMKLSEAR
jgi:hypothetical protein